MYIISAYCTYYDITCLERNLYLLQKFVYKCSELHALLCRELLDSLVLVQVSLLNIIKTIRNITLCVDKVDCALN